MQTQGEIQLDDSISQLGSRASKAGRVSNITNSLAKAAAKRVLGNETKNARSSEPE